MRLPVDEFHCTGVCYGTFTGWVNHRTDGLAVTVEFGSRVPSGGSAGRPAPSSRWAHCRCSEPTDVERIVPRRC